MSIIRGTQLFGHAMRMTKQSFKEFGKYLAIIWVVSSCLFAIYLVDRIHISNIKGEAIQLWYRLCSKGDNKILIADRQITEARKKIYLYYVKVNNVKYNKQIGDRIYYKSFTAQEIHDYKLTNTEIENFSQQIVKSMLYGLCVALFLLVFVFLFIIERGNNASGKHFVRGREILEKKEINRLIIADNKRENVRQNDNSYSIAGVSYPTGGEMEHLMIAGTTGTGKTVLIRDLLNQIRNNGDRAVIYDYTGTFTEGFYNRDKDVLLNPFDKRSSSWSLLEEVNNIAEFDTIAKALIGDNSNVSDPFWPNGARLIFAELCKVQYNTGDYNIKNLYKYLTSPLEYLHSALKGTLAANFTDPKSDKTTLSLVMLLATYLQALQYIDYDKNNKENNFSIKKWLLDETNDNMLFLTSWPSLHGSIQPIISGMMDIAINNIGEKKVGSKRKTWFIFDELASLNYLPSLEQGLTISRNYGGCFVIALQSISQLIKRYGTYDASTMSANCSSKVILRAGNHETATWASNVIGSREIEEYKEGLSYGANEIRDGVNLNKARFTEAIALPPEISALPKLQAYVSMTRGYPVSKVDFTELTKNKVPFINQRFIKKTDL